MRWGLTDCLGPCGMTGMGSIYSPGTLPWGPDTFLPEVAVRDPATPAQALATAGLTWASASSLSGQLTVRMMLQARAPLTQARR